MTTEHTDCEIISVRDIRQPREKVFEAWRDPRHLKRWWGPHGFTNTFHEFDFRPGGNWKLTMHGPEKGHYENASEFIDIVPPERIHWTRHSQPLFNVDVRFEEIAPDMTRITFRMIFPSPEAADKLRNFVPDKNQENFDRLEAVLKDM